MEAKVLQLGFSTVPAYADRLIEDGLGKGGCTLNTMAYQAAIPTEGYVVGGGYVPLVLPTALFGDEWPHRQQAILDVEDWLRSGIDGDRLPYHPYVGSWVAGGCIYFDWCRILFDRTEALSLAAARHEQAIYDLSTGESIPVDGSNWQEEAA